MILNLDIPFIIHFILFIFRILNVLKIYIREIYVQKVIFDFKMANQWLINVRMIVIWIMKVHVASWCKQ